MEASSVTGGPKTISTLNGYAAAGIDGLVEPSAGEDGGIARL